MKRAFLKASLLLAGSISLGACAAGEVDQPDAIEAPAAVAIGEPVDCLQLTRIQNTDVHGDRVIDFKMVDGTVYRNTLPNACPGLGFEERFGYETSIGRLCSLDTITVLRTGGINGPTCGLGKFVPVRLSENK